VTGQRHSSASIRTWTSLERRLPGGLAAAGGVPACLDRAGRGGRVRAPSSADGRLAEVRVLQLHNRHSSRGGADDVMDQERTVLAGAGHDVEQYVVQPASESSGGSLSQALAAVWNRDVTSELARLIDAFHPQVVHVHTPFPVMSPAVFRTAHRRGCATVATCHSYRYSCIKGTLLRAGSICEDCVGSRLKSAGVRHRCYHDSTAASLALTTSLVLHRGLGTFDHHVDRFITLTEFTRQLLVRDGIAEQQVVVKPNMSPDPGPQARSTRRLGYVAFIGRLVEEKGIRTLLAAWRSAPAGARLRIAGDGPLRPLVERAVTEGVDVDYLGWVDEAGIKHLVEHASLLVIPSEWYEAGPPLAMLRALAAGTPVLCSNLDNICGPVIDHGAGASFQTGDPASLAAAVTTALGDPDALARASERAREIYLTHHTPQATLDALEQIYADVLRRPAT